MHMSPGLAEAGPTRGSQSDNLRPGMLIKSLLTRPTYTQRNTGLPSLGSSVCVLRFVGDLEQS